MLDDFGVSKVTYDFIQNPNPEEKQKVADFIAKTLRESLAVVIDALAEK